MKPIKNVRKQLLTELWKLYTKQKAGEEETGLDTKPDIERMRGWFRMALSGSCTPRERVSRFGPDLTPTDNPLACEKCSDTGWYFSDSAEFERMGPKGRVTLEAPGIVVCFCAAGSQKNVAIREVNKKEPRGRRGGKFF